MSCEQRLELPKSRQTRSQAPIRWAEQFIEFMKRAFGAEEKTRVPTQDGGRIMHAEIKIGDSMMELSDGNE
jgi:PhnB protein